MHAFERADTIWMKASGADFKESIAGRSDKETKAVVGTLDTKLVAPVLTFVPLTLSLAVPELWPKQATEEAGTKPEISANHFPAGDLDDATWEDASWQ
jgi:hypothetical protein